MLFDNTTLFVVINIFLFAWLTAITFIFIRLLVSLKNITRGVSDKDIKSVLDDLITSTQKSANSYDNLVRQLDTIKKENLAHYQKIGLIRYNPFNETGGNQSFVLALLDGTNNGFVITSLHSRETTRVFAKPVKAGKEEGFELSKEELQAINSAKTLS